MAIYRNDQAQLTFAAESAQGADPEQYKGALESSGGTAAVDGAHEAGSRTLKVGTIGTAVFTVGDFIRIGEDATDDGPTTSLFEMEVRRIERISGLNTIGNGATFVLDRPLSYYHASGRKVYEIGAETASPSDKHKYLTFIPGVYETVDTPDPEMTIEGRHFLNTTSKRNFSVAYSGQQSLTGSVGGITLINGWPLRFPIGSVTTEPATSALLNSDTTLASDAKKGDIFISITSDTGMSEGSYVVIGKGTTSAEVRRLVWTDAQTNSSGNWGVNYPLSFDHTSGDSTHTVRNCSATGPFTHRIQEEVELDTVTWHVHVKDSSETTTKNFNRRYIGGMIGSCTIAAEEGGMLGMSWDSVNFLNMLHNQTNQKTLASGGSSAPASGDDYYGASVEANMPRFALMNEIDNDDIGEPYHNGNGANDGTGYPSTAPYYFSEGTIKFFGQTFAKIRGFSLSVSNSEEPRYYIGAQGSRQRGPYEILEGPREYSMSATVVLPDADVTAGATAANASQDSALELFRQLLLEGDYGANSGNKKGFTSSLRFDRGTNDYIIIDIPGSAAGSAGTPSTVTSDINSQGLFITSANHAIGGGTAMQVDLEMILRGVQITIVDSQPVYP